MKRKEEANRLIAQAVQKQQAQDEARKRKAASALSASPPPPPQKIIALQPLVVPMATSAPQNTMPVAVQGGFKSRSQSFLIFHSTPEYSSS